LLKDGAAVLETRETGHAPGVSSTRRAPTLRRDLSEDFAGLNDGPEYESSWEPEAAAKRRRAGKASGKGVKVRFRAGVPQTALGRWLVAGTAVVTLGAMAGLVWGARRSVLQDRRFAIPSSSAIQITGNSHLTQAQLLSVFGEDVDRNVLTISLEQRRQELEQLPWVEHATVMRLLPNKLRVAITERTPVAFYRQGGLIGLVDANGVLLDMPEEQTPGPDGKVIPMEHYSFPVITGLSAEDPQATRAARVRIFQRFMTELGKSPDKVAERLSEVDLSSPEDVKALIPSGTNDVLVHFGDDQFLERYHRFEENLPKWRQDYPKLASADMRYPRQVVLEMQPGSSVPLTGNSEAVAVRPGETKAPNAKVAAARTVKTAPVAANKTAAHKPWVKPVAPHAVAKKPVAVHPAAHTHLQTAFAVPSKKAGSKTHTVQAGPR
jgi:cell division protein FtsQ